MAQPPDPAKIASQLIELRMEHRDLDAAIAKLVADPDCDDLAIKRLHKIHRLQGQECEFCSKWIDGSA